MAEFIIRQLVVSDHDWVRHIMITEWGAEIVVVHGEIFHPADLPGYAAFEGTKTVGLLTYKIKGNEFEIVTLDSWRERSGIGTSLINMAIQTANLSGCKRLFLVTTNNNTRALHFYQKRGFVISGVRDNAVAKSRELKPQIPVIDEDGLPIRDEIELELFLR